MLSESMQSVGVDRAEAVLLERICAAYNKATQSQVESKIYCATTWWQSIEQKHLERVREALRCGDLPRLHSMYSEFFHDACGNGLVRRPPAYESDGFTELDEDAQQVIREDMLYRLGYWRAETQGRYPASVLTGAKVGNPFGATIEGVFIPVGAEYQHACADRILSFIDGRSTVVELGGGFGHMAYFLLTANCDVTYINFDVPESLALCAYYLGQSLPDKKLLLYGEQEFSCNSVSDFDVVLMPPSEMARLTDKSVDMTFSSHVLADLAPPALGAYVGQIARFTKGPVMAVSIEKSSEDREALLRTMAAQLRLIQERRWDWNKYRAPDAREWEDLYMAVCI